ncbi:MAG: helix-turn-helix domain-containing protein [Actinomycetia bacterium]|nr:helix-turn-helix domain-containing protein [Actinomycetes bacterium]
MSIEPRWLSTQAAATYLGYESRRSLERLREKGQGPQFSRRGSRILYRVQDLDAWAEAGLVDPGAEHRGARPLQVVA